MAYKRTSHTSKSGIRRTTTFNNKTRNITTAVSTKGGNTRITHSRSSNGTEGTYRTTNFNGWVTREKLNKKQKPIKYSRIKKHRQRRVSSSSYDSGSFLGYMFIGFIILIIGVLSS